MFSFDVIILHIKNKKVKFRLKKFFLQKLSLKAVLKFVFLPHKNYSVQKMSISYMFKYKYQK
jgi:hypothetical protein